MLFLDFSEALPFLAAAILIFTTAAAFQGLKLLEGPLFHPLAGAGLFLAVSGIYVLQSLSPLRDLAPCLAGTVLVGISAWYYQPLLQAGEEQLAPDSLLFLAGSILLALVDVELAGISIGRALLCLLLAYTAYQRGTMAGAAAGLGAGLAADFCSGSGGVLFGAAYGLAGLLAGSRSGGRRIWAALAFWGAAVLAALPGGPRHAAAAGGGRGCRAVSAAAGPGLRRQAGEAGGGRGIPRRPGGDAGPADPHGRRPAGPV